MFDKYKIFKIIDKVIFTFQEDDMFWFERFYQNKFSSFLVSGKVLVMYGPRRVGKTSLIKKFLETYEGKVYAGAGEDMPLRDLFRSQNISMITDAFSGYDIVFIDEAQKITDVGTALKIIVDHIPGVKVIASGSSSFELSARLGEPLTGRNRSMLLFPLSMLEIKEQFGPMNILQNLESYLIFGTYPEVMTADNNNNRKEYLINLRDSFLFRDILELENIKSSDKLSDLLRLLAFQIGHEVSANELGTQLGMSKNTVEKYLDLLEKSFVIRKVRGFSRNLRKEITKNSRYYFLDNGIRNAVINNFNPVNSRDDIGMLWENFLFIERMKKLNYQALYSNVYFWRTYDGKEIDLVEERDGKLSGYEFKWSGKKTKPVKLWNETYPDADFETITRENFLNFVS